MVLLAVALVGGGSTPSGGAGYPATPRSHDDIQVTELLGEDGEPLLWARRVNERGQVVAVDERFYITLAGHTLWHRGTATRLEADVLDLPPDIALPEPGDISRRGHLAGRIAELLPFVWKNGQYLDLGEPLAEHAGRFTAVNDHGRATGWWIDLSESDDLPQTVAWHDGELVVAPIGRVEAGPVGINNRSQVLINLPTEEDGSWRDGPTVAALWQVGGGVTELGGLDEAGTSQGIALNEWGQVAGNSETADGETHAFLWQRGEMTDLGTLGGGRSVVGSDELPWTITVTGTATIFGAPVSDDRLALNERGHVVGTSETADGETHAFLWQRGEMTDLGTLGGATSSAQAVNNHGQVVGVSETADGETHAFVWQDGEMTDLGAVADAEESSLAMDINDRGQIVGQVDGGVFGEGRAVMWTVPPR